MMKSKKELIEEIDLKFEEFCKIMDTELNLSSIEEDEEEDEEWDGKE